MFLSLLSLVLAGCAKDKRSRTTLRFHEQVSDVLPGSRVRIVEVPSSNERVAVDPFPQLSEKDVMEARIEPTPGGNAVWLRFDLHGAMKLGELTTRMRGGHVVVFVNERPVACVLIDKLINNGEFLLEGELTDAEQQQLVDDLNKLAGHHRDKGDVRHAP